MNPECTCSSECRKNGCECEYCNQEIFQEASETLNVGAEL